jgi:FAD/FMN-containing dehydrogenase
MSEQAIPNFRGRQVRPSDAGYDNARAVYNGMINKRPALIAQCADVADVIAAVNYAREKRCVLAVRGGGHSGPGFGTCDEGLVIDLSQLKGVRVDAKARTARVEPGCTAADLDHATHAFGLAVPLGIVGNTGVAGLTLGGGSGYLTRKHGLTIDNLLEVDIVLADGSFVTASKNENTDLFWAVRGGGGNFGVVTSFLFQAQPAKMVFAGPAFWDVKDAKAVMTMYRDFIAKAPEELGLFVGLKTVPPTEPFPKEHWGKRACALVGAFNGPIAEGQKLMASLLAKLPAPLFNWMSEMPFPAMNALFDPFFPKGLQWYWKGDYVKQLTDEAIETHIANAVKAPTPFCLMHLYPVDGAVHRIAKDATPWGARDAMFSMVIAGISPDPKDADALRAWGRAYWKAVHPFNMDGAYVNFLDADEAENRVEASYGANYARLATIKAKYDPNNLFRMNQNIKPAKG